MLSPAADVPALRKVVLQLLASGQLEALANELRPFLAQATDDMPGGAAQAGTAAAAPQPQADAQGASRGERAHGFESGPNSVELARAAGEAQQQQQQQQRQQQERQQGQQRQPQQLSWQQQEGERDDTGQAQCGSPITGVCRLGASWQVRTKLPGRSGKLRDMQVLRHADPAVAVAVCELVVFWKGHVRGKARSSQYQGPLHAR
jgi:hypothetical protein